MDPAAAGVGSWDTELAWHLLTVLLRIGRPAAAAELAAVASTAASNAVTPQRVERLCRAPGSPLRYSGGVVTVSGTAVVAFLRFLGWDVPAAVPRVRSRPFDLRRFCAEFPIRYERKRKSSDADRFGVKRRLLMDADADLVEDEQQQPIVQSCSSVATGEFLGVSGDNLLGSMISTLVRKESLVPSFIDIPSLRVEESENIHAADDNKISRIGEPEGALSSYYNCRVEDSEDREKESSPPPMIVEVALVGDKKIWVDEDLNLFHRRPCSPSLSCDTQLVDSIVRTSEMPDQAAVQNDTPNAGHCEEIPSCGEDANTCLLFQSSTHTKEEPLLHELLHEMNKSLCQPSLATKVELVALPLEATSHDCINNRNLNIISENIDSTHLKDIEQPHNEVGTTFPKKGKNRKMVKQRGKRKKNDALPKEDKDQLAENAQKSATDTKAEPVLHEPVHEMDGSSCQPSLATKVELAALPLEVTSNDCINNKNLNIIAENIDSTHLKDREQPDNEVGTIFPKEQDIKMVKQQEKRKKNGALPKEDKDQLAEHAQKSAAHTNAEPVLHEPIHEMNGTSCQPSLATKVELAALPLETTSHDCINKRNLNIIAENTDSTHLKDRDQPDNEVGTIFPKEQDIKMVKQQEKRKKNGSLPKEDKVQLAEHAQKSATHTKAEPVLHEPIHEMNGSSCQPSLATKVELAALPLETMSHDCINKRNLNIIAENTDSTHLKDREQPDNTIFPKKAQDIKMVKQREKRKKNDALPKEDKDQLAEKDQKGHAEPKPLPSFKHFVVEEEEGSGGYGIVYRARRNTDGKVFAIKCPRGKAHSHHVDNERKMLERFGGKSFVIRYEGCFRKDELDCFVLEHVKHDRPEILKKEINVFELQWYGYCLFKALSCLHKQGIVHRDVKPGNFLFSRDQTKGYLVDFNLASDLHHKFLKNSKSETISCGKDTASQSSVKSALVIHAKEAAVDTKQPLGSKRKRSNKSPVGSDPRIDNKSRHGSQAADISGVTSAKDPTSTKASLEKLKQPMLYKGRKELMSFLHEAMQSPKQSMPAAPVSQRKRVAAPVSSVDQKLFVLTPMPLRADGNAVAGSGALNSKGPGKQRREGACVGTKGFRAPEVLLRSSHQGCKVDVWSAGVTLLYFIIGKAPFGGDPEQNMKEIAKIRGSEELWEVAKLHNCESSYPSELFDVKSLQSVDIREWCMANARRPEFLDQVPDSLFDLVDKCLAVNPRCRITSEDALSHEFLAPCRESLKRQSALRIRSASASHPPPCLPRDAMVNPNEL